MLAHSGFEFELHVCTIHSTSFDSRVAASAISPLIFNNHIRNCAIVGKLQKIRECLNSNPHTYEDRDNDSPGEISMFRWPSWSSWTFQYFLCESLGWKSARLCRAYRIPRLNRDSGCSTGQKSQRKEWLVHRNVSMLLLTSFSWRLGWTDFPMRLATFKLVALSRDKC